MLSMFEELDVLSRSELKKDESPHNQLQSKTKTFPYLNVASYTSKKSKKIDSKAKIKA